MRFSGRKRLLREEYALVHLSKVRRFQRAGRFFLHAPAEA